MLLLVKQKSLESKWEEVRTHYESAYHFRFKFRPNDAAVENLWLKLQMLHQSFLRHENTRFGRNDDF